MVIKAGQFAYAGESEPRYLPSGWSSHIQPEGKRYFVRDSSPRIVTDAYIYSSITQEKVLHFAAAVVKMIDAKQISLPDSAEVYLSPSESEDECGYYVADHATHILFWLEEVDLDQLSIPDVVSEEHLRYTLGDLYWQHIEQFPSHSPNGLSLAVDDLIAIFIHGQGDHMTSENSTFPYVAKECKNFIRVLEGAKQRLDHPGSICIVARLWSVISRSRVQTHYAQERTRLACDQLILDLPEAPRGRIFAAASRLLFGIPQTYAAKLDRVFSDEIVFVHPWRNFMTQCRAEWQQYLSWAPFLYEAKEASPGFRRTGLEFSAPRAAFIWAAVIASLQALFWLQHATNIFVVAALAGVALASRLPWARWTGKVFSVLPRCRRDREEEGIFKV
ncbi:hypothetical protein TRAPUB_7140 [Trametes pubescens]|uniref:WW domain-containing protein n=1 Tax=Trametes pubescens TaxID=154538 RepID=A0A1M2V474_TRAPU|nr:hypothetical protein TRAPUB_7140 [Trametes pubescens]